MSLSKILEQKHTEEVPTAVVAPKGITYTFLRLTAITLPSGIKMPVVDGAVTAITDEEKALCEEYVGMGYLEKL